jgi:hypothetical protein
MAISRVREYEITANSPTSSAEIERRCNRKALRLSWSVGEGPWTSRVICIGCKRAWGPSYLPKIGEKVGGGRGCRIGEIGVSSASTLVMAIVGVSSREALMSISSSKGKLPGMGVSCAICCVLVLFCLLVSAPLAADSFLWSAFAGSERPSTNQLGSGKLNREDFSDVESSAGTNLEEDRVLEAAGFGVFRDGFDLGGILSLCDVMRL